MSKQNKTLLIITQLWSYVPGMVGRDPFSTRTCQYMYLLCPKNGWKRSFPTQNRSVHVFTMSEEWLEEVLSHLEQVSTCIYYVPGMVGRGPFPPRTGQYTYLLCPRNGWKRSFPTQNRSVHVFTVSQEWLEEVLSHSEQVSTCIYCVPRNGWMRPFAFQNR